jgi:hypothetical protein
MRKEDTWEFQTDRIRKLVAERAPGKTITFDLVHTITVRFRIVDPESGKELVEFQEWKPDRLSEMSDDDLWQKIRDLSNGRL